MTYREFIAVLASKEPTPGGGGASALVGAIGTSLGIMLKGLVGIFAVILVIMLFVKLMSKAFDKKK